ncbi:MAG: substrate-binding domain-containing protein [Rhodobacteraceae bacterium]|nr:substrate-binding domain-containing protein [Paracoccaceae bacterium]
MASGRLIAAVILLGSLLSSPAGAEDVTLRSRDGSVEVTGEFLNFDGEFFQIRTVHGELMVDASGVICEGAGCPDLNAYVSTVRFSGAADIVLEMMPSLVEAFAARNGYDHRVIIETPERFIYELGDRPTNQIAARFFFDATNSSEGLKVLAGGEADIAVSMREVTPVEIRAAQAARLGDLTSPRQSQTLALDALVPITGDRNPVSSLTVSELVKIMSGEIRNWSELGGEDAPIDLHMRNRSSGLPIVFERRLLAQYDLELSEQVNWHLDSQEMADTVAQQSTAIALASRRETGNAKVISLRGNCGFPLDHGNNAVKTDDYPLTAPFYLYFPDRRLPKIARDFLSYLRTPQAQAVIRSLGYVDLSAELTDLDEEGRRLLNAILKAEDATGLTSLKSMVAELGNAGRLSLSFRFDGGISRLDTQSRSAINLMALALEAGFYDDRELILVGFSDGRGDAAANLGLARRRAIAVREALFEAAPTADFSRAKIGVLAMGEAMPIACDDEDWGRDLNRRVEIWMRYR